MINWLRDKEYIYADNDYAEAMNFEVLAGKTSITEIAQDTAKGFVVNEILINCLALGPATAAIGKYINVHGFDAPIIGVVKDFHTLSLHEAIKPVAVIYGIKNYNNLGINYQTGDISAVLTQLEKEWKIVFPDKNFDYYFQDEQLGNMYESEMRFAQIINLFTIISIIIACIGLIGLSAFSSVNPIESLKSE